MFDTALTRVLGIDVPIVQAPIGNLTCPELVAAVSNAGALGMLSAGTCTLFGLLSAPSPHATIAAATAAPPAVSARNCRRFRQCSQGIGQGCAARSTKAAACWGVMAPSRPEAMASGVGFMVPP